MKIEIPIFISIIFCLSSCIGPFAPKEHKLSSEAYNLNPYPKEVTLIFESDTKEIDSIRITGLTKAMIKGGDGFSGSPDTFENYRINYITSTSGAEKGLMYVGWFDESYNVRFELELTHSRLFCLCNFSKSAFNLLPDATFTVLDQTYTDVKILNSDPYYENRNHRVLNFYWSISNGLLGWDTPTSTWRLKEVVE